MDKIAIDSKVCLYELLPADPVKLIEADSRSEAVGIEKSLKTQQIQPDPAGSYLATYI